jgi:hypothetical protein
MAPTFLYRELTWARITMGATFSLGVFADSRISVDVAREPTTNGLALAAAIFLAPRAGGRFREPAN